MDSPEKLDSRNSPGALCIPSMFPQSLWDLRAWPTAQTVLVAQTLTLVAAVSFLLLGDPFGV